MCNEFGFLYITEIYLCKSAVPIGWRLLELSSRRSMSSLEAQGLQQWWAVGGHWDPRKQLGLLHSSMFLMIDCREIYCSTLSYWTVFLHSNFCSCHRVEWALRLGDVLSSIWGDVQELGWKILYIKQEAETTSKDISQHWTQCEILSGLSEGHWSGNAAWTSHLRYFSPVVPSQEREKSCLARTCPVYETAAFCLCHCSQVLLLAHPSRLQSGVKQWAAPCMTRLPRKQV